MDEEKVKQFLETLNDGIAYEWHFTDKEMAEYIFEKYGIWLKNHGN